MAQSIRKYINSDLENQKVIAKEITFLVNILTYGEFPLKTYPRNIYESFEGISEFKENVISNGHERPHLRFINDIEELLKVTKENKCIFQERILIISDINVLQTLPRLDIYQREMQQSLDPVIKHKSMTIVMCCIIDSLSYYAKGILQKADRLSPHVLNGLIELFTHNALLHLCFVEELLPIEAAASDASKIVAKLRKKVFSLLKLVGEVDKRSYTEYFSGSLEKLLREHNENPKFILSKENIAFIDIKYLRLYKQFNAYMINSKTKIEDNSSANNVLSSF